MAQTAIQKIQGRLLNYRVGPRSQRSKECIIQFSHVSTFSEACKLVGRKVVWMGGKNKIVGQIVNVHGKKGLVTARFRRGVPGQALGTSVELVS
jgi:large subunit ribosomal protein L35Ae